MLSSTDAGFKLCTDSTKRSIETFSLSLSLSESFITRLKAYRTGLCGAFYYKHTKDKDIKVLI